MPGEARLPQNYMTKDLKVSVAITHVKLTLIKHFTSLYPNLDYLGLFIFTVTMVTRLLFSPVDSKSCN